jgi:hypothetical protein
VPRSAPTTSLVERAPAVSPDHSSLGAGAPGARLGGRDALGPAAIEHTDRSGQVAYTTALVSLQPESRVARTPLDRRSCNGGRARGAKGMTAHAGPMQGHETSPSTKRGEVSEPPPIRLDHFCLCRIAAHAPSASTRAETCIRVATQPHRRSLRDAVCAVGEFLSALGPRGAGAPLGHESASTPRIRRLPRSPRGAGRSFNRARVSVAAGKELPASADTDAAQATSGPARLPSRTSTAPRSRSRALSASASASLVRSSARRGTTITPRSPVSSRCCRRRGIPRCSHPCGRGFALQPWLNAPAAPAGTGRIRRAFARSARCAPRPCRALHRSSRRRVIASAPIPWTRIESITVNATVQNSCFWSSAGRTRRPIRNEM